MPARVKLKENGGILYMNWKLRLNSIQRAETYQGHGACESRGWLPATIVPGIVHGHPKPME